MRLSIPVLSSAIFLFIISISACSSKKTEEPSPFVPKFIVNSVAPSGDIPGATVTIRGTEFGTDTSAIRVRFGGTKAVSPLTVTNEMITVNIPPYAITGKIEVIKGGTTVASPYSFEILEDKTDYSIYSSIAFTKTDYLPSRHYALSAAATGDVIAFAATTVPGGVTVTVIDLYNVISRRWTTINKDLGQGIRMAAAGNKICFAGVSNVDIYDVNKEEWTSAKLSTPRWNITAIGTGNKIVFAGGQQDPYGGSATDLVDIYDLVANTWSTAKLSIARFGMVGATAKGKIILAGSTFVSGPTRVDVYDVTANRWTTTEMPNARSGFSVAGSGDVVVFSGNMRASYMLSYVDIYNVNTNSWKYVSVPSDHFGEFSVSGGTKVLVTMDNKTVRAYDVTNDSYETILTSGQWRATACVKNKVIANTVAGGYDIYTLSK